MKYFFCKIPKVEKVIVAIINLKLFCRVLFLDAISHLSRGKLSISLDRYIQVDIDDMFVGSVGSRMNREDVDVRLKLLKRF